MQGRLQWSESTDRAPWRRPILYGLGLVLVLGVGFYLSPLQLARMNPFAPAPVRDSVTSGDWQDLTSNIDLQAREGIYHQSLRTGAGLPDWPATPQGVIEDFWSAASRKDYARMALLCPGSTQDDFRRYYEHWTPSPAKAVGRGAPHRSRPGVIVYPARLDFPFFANKTILMAVRRLEDERWIIDGQHTIWW